MDVTGKTILLTGATGGIGAALADCLQSKGAELILTGRRIDRLQTMADRLGAAFVAADLSRWPDPDRLTQGV